MSIDDKIDEIPISQQLEFLRTSQMLQADSMTKIMVAIDKLTKAMNLLIEKEINYVPYLSKIDISREG